MLVGASLYTLHTELSKEGEEGGDILADGVRVVVVVGVVVGVVVVGVVGVVVVVVVLVPLCLGC